MTTKIKATHWNTYHLTGYTRDVANDQASAGGVHLHQVRRTRGGHWQARICQSNGRHRAYGPVESITEAEGLAYFARAESY